MGHKIGLATVCLHISAVLYLIIGVLLLMFDDDARLGMPFAVGMLLFFFVLVGGTELVVYGLHRRRFWAWVAGLCIFGVYVPSLFFPLGALGLWGLLDSGSRAQFGLGGDATGV